MTELVTFKLSQDLLEFAEQVAREEGISVAAVARRALLRERAACLANRVAIATAEAVA